MVSNVKADLVRHWSTDHVAPAGRLDYFAAALTEAVVPFAVNEGNPQSFYANLSFANIDAIGVCKVNGAAHSSSRGPLEMAQTEEHTVNLLMSLDTNWSVVHRGHLQLQPRDILIHDSEYPLFISVPGRFTSINVSVTNTWLRHWIPNLGALGTRPIPGNSAWGCALSSYLAALSPHLVEAPPLPLPLMADQVGSLLALTAGALRNRAPGTSARSLRSLKDRIIDCLAQRCTEPMLTAPDVAASLNISLRTLHRALADGGQTFGVLLIAARARVAQRMLTSPLFVRVTTAEIGRRAGFMSASHFARVIRHRTGHTPQVLRRITMSREADPAEPADNTMPTGIPG